MTTLASKLSFARLAKTHMYAHTLAISHFIPNSIKCKFHLKIDEDDATTTIDHTFPVASIECVNKFRLRWCRSWIIYYTCASVAADSVCLSNRNWFLSFSFLWMANQNTEQCSIDLLIDTWPMLTIVPVGRWTALSFCWFCLIGEKGNSTSSLIWFWFHTRKSHNLRTNNTNAQRTIETHISRKAKQTLTVVTIIVIIVVVVVVFICQTMEISRRK